MKDAPHSEHKWERLAIRKKNKIIKVGVKIDLWTELVLSISFEHVSYLWNDEFECENITMEHLCMIYRNVRK